MNSENKRHFEITLFLFLVPLINLFNYFLTYNNITFSARTFLTFGIDTLEGYVSWLAVHFIIGYLDTHLPYGRNPLKRLGVQLLSTMSAGIGIIIGLTVLLNFFASNKPIPISFYTLDIPIISIWFLVTNGVYVGLHFYREWQVAETKRMEENEMKSAGFPVRIGKQELLLSFEEIAGFFIEDDYVICCTRHGKKYIADQSMDGLEKNLPITFFFRLNRQFLVHRQLILGFERAENGRLRVFVGQAPLFPGSIPVSRTRAADFKSWFRQSQVTLQG